MVTLLITTLFIAVFLAVTIYFWQRPASKPQPEVLPPAPGPRGILAELASVSEKSTESNTHTAVLERRAALLAQAGQGDKSTLNEAFSAGDIPLYKEVLNLLVTAVDSDSKLLTLISYVTRHELPVNRTLAERCIQLWHDSPGRDSTAKMLHIAALSDDAGVYQAAVDATLNSWRRGTLQQISSPELQAILEGEFWVLSSKTRNSGAGFLLKRTLASVRRELKRPLVINNSSILTELKEDQQ